MPLPLPDVTPEQLKRALYDLCAHDNHTHRWNPRGHERAGRCDLCERISDARRLVPELQWPWLYTESAPVLERGEGE
jgi:hypothetical protein